MSRRGLRQTWLLLCAAATWRAHPTRPARKVGKVVMTQAADYEMLQPLAFPKLDYGGRRWMDWKADYRGKVTTAERAVELIQLRQPRRCRPRSRGTDETARRDGQESRTSTRTSSYCT